MNLLLGIAIIVVADALAIAALLFVRRGAPEGSYFSDGDRASGVFGVLATGFAIFAGFVIFLAFTTYDDTRSGAEAEALAVIQQYETAQFLPVPIKDEVTGQLECYGRYVVHQEWPRMESGTIGDTINPWALALFRSLKAAQPEAATEQSAYDKWLDQTSVREAARLDRIHGAVGHHPDLDLDRPVPHRVGGVRLHAVLRGQRRDGPLAGDADRLGDDGDRRHAAGDHRARQPVP